MCLCVCVCFTGNSLNYISWLSCLCKAAASLSVLKLEILRADRQSGRENHEQLEPRARIRIPPRHTELYVVSYWLSWVTRITCRIWSPCHKAKHAYLVRKAEESTAQQQHTNLFCPLVLPWDWFLFWTSKTSWELLVWLFFKVLN